MTHGTVNQQEWASKYAKEILFGIHKGIHKILSIPITQDEFNNNITVAYKYANQRSWGRDTFLTQLDGGNIVGSTMQFTCFQPRHMGNASLFKQNLDAKL